MLAIVWHDQQAPLRRLARGFCPHCLYSGRPASLDNLKVETVPWQHEADPTEWLTLI